MSLSLGLAEPGVRGVESTRGSRFHVSAARGRLHAELL